MDSSLTFMDSMRARRSVRTYQYEPLTPEVRSQLTAYLADINQLKGPFGNKVRIELVDKDDQNQEFKLGTYGVIKGAQTFLAVACEKNDHALEDLGFLFEKVILFCTSIGLGTVWIGGTFNKGNFSKAMNLKSNEILPIVSPVGYESSQKSFLSKLMGGNSSKRFAFEEVFFDTNFETALTEEKANSYADVLEMIRMAPSAMNKQPWRILKDGNTLHMYSAGKIDMSQVDIGIAMCHLSLSSEEKGLGGIFKTLPHPNHPKFKYVISWTC